MRLIPMQATDVPAKKGQSIYPQPYAQQVAGRIKHKLGNEYGLENFGVNLTILEPGAVSALYHFHTAEDEFVYILEGTPTLVLDNKEYLMQPGECCGFKAGTGTGHQLVNKSDKKVVYIEIGNRSSEDKPEYPNDDLVLTWLGAGAHKFTHKDGSEY